MSSTWASVVPADKVPKDYPHHLDGLYDRPGAPVSSRPPRNRAHRGHRAGFLGVGSGGDQGQRRQRAGHSRRQPAMLNCSSSSGNVVAKPAIIFLRSSSTLN